MDVEVRPATTEELPDVRNVLDAGLLQVDADTLAARLDAGDVLGAGGTRARGGPLLGVLVLDGEEVVAVAVRRRRRGQGIGTALVRAALDRRDTLVAQFDGRVRPFWESLGFTVEATDEEGRYRGRFPA